MLSNLLKRTSLPQRSLCAVAALCTAGLLAGCGTSASVGSTTTASTPSGPQFDQRLVPPPQKGLAFVPKGNQNSSTKTTKNTTKKPGKTTATTGSSVTSGGSSPAPVTRVTRTITITHTVTVVHKVSPNVPPGAQLPSNHRAVSLTRFTAPGGNVGCVLGGGVARCDVANRVWRPPAKPSSCHLAWGQGISVGPGAPVGFVCAGDSVLNPDGIAIPNGYDDRVGSVTCQVRVIGVTCFDSNGSGFSISRTGYTVF
jgi:hypothetical protein